MTENFEHSRFLMVKDGAMHFGCINPFCGHGSPAMPHHWEIPLETKSIKIGVVSHNNRLVCFIVYLKKDVGKHKAKETVKLTCADNLDACKSVFNDLYAGKETTQK